MNSSQPHPFNYSTIHLGHGANIISPNSASRRSSPISAPHPGLMSAMMPWGHPAAAMQAPNPSEWATAPRLHHLPRRSSAMSMCHATSSQASTAAPQASAIAFSSDSAATPNGTTVDQPSSSSATSSKKRPRKAKRGKRYNSFNIFFMLERQLLLHARGGGIDAIANPIDVTDSPLVKHSKGLKLNLPSLCERYAHLPLTCNWFLELQSTQQGKKRLHRKSHGLIPFKELAGKVSKNYREIDADTRGFVKQVSEMLGKHCDEIEAEECLNDGALLGVEDGSGAVATSLTNAGISGRIGDAGTKRKSAPVISEPTSLSEDEVLTVQQLKRLKTHSPPMPVHHPAAHTFSPSADSESARLRQELARAISAHNAHIESERRIEMKIQLLKEEMMISHHMKTQQRVEQSSFQSARTPALWGSLPTGYKRYSHMNMNMMEGSSSPPALSAPALARAVTGYAESSAPAPRNPAHFAQLENEMIKEEFLRRLARLPFDKK